MRNCQPIQIAILLLGSALACAAQQAGAASTGGTIAGRGFASGLALLVRHECRRAATYFQQALMADPNLAEARILLGLSYDCSGDRLKLTAAFRHIWDHDLDPQEPTPEMTLAESALQAGFNPRPQSAEGKYFWALLYYRLGNLDSALAELQAAPAPVAGSWAYYNLMGSAHLRQAQFTEARQTLETAMQRNSKQADTFYKLGTVLLATGDAATATARLRQAVQLRPDFPAANAALGIALLQTGNFAAAREFLAKGTSVGAEVFVYLGTANEHLGDKAAAIENYQKALSRQPQLFAAEFSLGHLLLSSGDSAALTHLERATQLDPTSAQGQLYLALALVAAKQTEKAAASASQAQALGSAEGADFNDALAGVFQEIGQSDQALENFRQAAAPDPANENYLRHLAAAEHNAGDTAGAIATLRSGVARVPNSARLNYLLGISLMSNGATPEALPPLGKAVELEPDNADYEQSLGVCLAELEKDADAMAAFRKVLLLDPNHVSAYLQIGVLQSKTNLAEAEQSFTQALGIDPNYAPAYFRIGKIYYDRNEDAQALKFLEKTRDLDPDWEDTYFLLGTIYKRAGNEERSAEMFATFRKKKNELQELRRKTLDLAPGAFDDAKTTSASR
jgi:tetratricopeptide (TPR) repeat protein